MKIKYNIADIRPDVLEFMLEDANDLRLHDDMEGNNLYWMLTFATTSEKAEFYGMCFYYIDRLGTDDYSLLGVVELWETIYKKAKKDAKQDRREAKAYKHEQERRTQTH